jgi:hypothetical protein
MPTHVTISPLHEGKHAHAREIVEKLEAHLGRKSTPVEGGHRFEAEEHDASDLSGALDAVAPHWRDHVAMGL